MVGACLSKNIQSTKYRGTLHLHIEDPTPRFFIMVSAKYRSPCKSVNQGELVLQFRVTQRLSGALEKRGVCGTRDRSDRCRMREATGIESVVGAPGLALAIAIGAPPGVDPDGLLRLESGRYAQKE
jgi:hypothetical protein